MGDTDSLIDLLAALFRPAALTEMAAVALCLVLAFGVVKLLRRSTAGDGILLGRRGYDGALFPLLALGFALAARALFQGHQRIVFFKLAVPLLASLCIIRISVRVLHSAFPDSRPMRTLERTVSWLVWLGFVLWVTNLVTPLLQFLESVRWTMGGTEFSLRKLIEGGLSAAVVLVLSLWASAAIEARVLAASGVSLSVRMITANAARALLLLVGFLVAMSAAGIPLAALSVVGGAVGVGIGFGLQKLAANYVSGFVILAERSLRIGDVVKIDNFEGSVSDIKTRYTVLRAPNGRESLVPNEMMITQRVENCHFADPNVALTSMVQVAYGTDLGALIPKLLDAMRAVPRVLANPGPAVQLSNFASDGLELTLVFWIGDIQNGQGNVRSDINLAVLKVINEAGVEIPFPQRVVRSA